jgi:hypothetical protein
VSIFFRSTQFILSMLVIKWFDEARLAQHW